MSAQPVDVLDAFDRLGDLLESCARTDAARLYAMLRDVTATRAAVAELIEENSKLRAAASAAAHSIGQAKFWFDDQRANGRKIPAHAFTYDKLREGAAALAACGVKP